MWGAEALRLLHQAGREIVGVVLRATPTDGTLEAAARELGYPVFQPARCNAPAFLGQIRDLRPDLNLSVSYDQILKRPILDSAPRGFVNFHAGKLPHYRGRSVVNWAIINGESEIGITAHFVDEGIDTGDIILQRTLPVGWTDSYGDVLPRVIAAFPGLVADTVELLTAGNFSRTPQSPLAGSYFPRRGPGDECLDWGDKSWNLYNKIRGISRPAPGAASWIEGAPVTIWRAEYDASWPEYIATPGQVVGVEPGRGARVKTGDSTLLVTEAQMGDNAPFTPQWRIGSRLAVNIEARLRDVEARLARMETRSSQP